MTTLSYVLDETGHFLGSTPRFVVPKSLVPAIMALVYTIYDYPCVAYAIAIAQQHSLWSSLKKDICNYVIPCGRRRQKRSASQRIAILLSARFIRPWEVLDWTSKTWERSRVLEKSTHFSWWTEPESCRLLFHGPRTRPRTWTGSCWISS